MGGSAAFENGPDEVEADGTGVLEVQWMELAHELNAPPFAAPGVVAAAHRTNGLGRLRIFRTKSGPRLDGVFTLHRARSIRDSGVQKLLGARSGPTARCHDTAVRLLLEAADNTGQLVQITELDGEKHDVPRLVADLEANGCVVEAVELFPSPYIELAEDGEAQRARLSRKRRQNLDRSRRRLDELGDVRFDMVDTIERAVDPTTVDGLLELEEKSWKGQLGSAMASSDRSEGYFRSVIEWAAAEKVLHLNGLYLDDRLIAASFAVRLGDTLYGMKTTYDEEYRKHGPGLLLLQEEILHAIDRGIRRLDLLGPAANHKTDFATGTRPIWQLTFGLRKAVPLAQLRVGRPVDHAARALGFRYRQARSGLRSRRRQ